MTSFVSLPTMMLIEWPRLRLRPGGHQPRLGELDDLLGGAEHRLLEMQVGQVGVGQQAESLLGVGAVQADDERHVDLDPPEGLDDPLGDLVAAGDAAEDVEEDRDHLRVGGDHLERVDDRVGLGATAGVEEVGGTAPGLGDDVEGGHAEAGAVAEDADVAVELHVGEALLLRHALLGVLDEALLQVGEVLMPEERGVVDRHLGVERDHVAVLGDDQGIDLDQGGVALVEGLMELHEHRRGLLPGVLGDARSRRQGLPPPRHRSPCSGSMWRRTSASGSFSAISSTFMPPIVESIASSFFAERSRMIEA